MMLTLRSLPTWFAIPLLLWSEPSMGAVTEPNGLVVPGESSNPDEQPLQSYFDSVGEQIVATTDASAEPGVFSPLCDFEATLVLSESGAEAGIAWYNADPGDPTRVPAASELYELVPIGEPVGNPVGSGDIRVHPDYAGGLVGFALMKSFSGDPDNPVPEAVYFSEYQRNALCSQCTIPGHWKMTISYPSTLDPSMYYLAFEDWEGANSSDWGGNDGDFNDKVFRIRGVTCVGGGEPCDTGLPGVCGGGLYECQPGGELECRAQLEPTEEVCDNLDNNCDGIVDRVPNLCPTFEACVQGRCVPSCSTGEFPCEPLQTCVSDVCIENACVNVECAAGQICRGGECVGGCEGVVCPLGQQCHPQLGLCLDPCASVTCGVGEVCEGGVCVVSCTCRPCSAAQTCDLRDGECVDTGCETQSCDAGFVCVAGTCVDACAAAACPGGAACSAGVCGEADLSETPQGTAGAGNDFVIGAANASSTAAGSPGSGDQGSGDQGSDSGTFEPPPSSDAASCACRLDTRKHPLGAAVGATTLLALLLLQRRRRSLAP